MFLPWPCKSIPSYFFEFKGYLSRSNFFRINVITEPNLATKTSQALPGLNVLLQPEEAANLLYWYQIYSLTEVPLQTLVHR